MNKSENIKNSKSPPRKKSPVKTPKTSTRYLLQSNSYNGSLDIRADRLELTPIGEKFIKSVIGKRGSLKIYWNFMNFPAAQTPAILINSKVIDIKHTACYEVSINEAFLRYLSTRPITFEVYLLNYRQEVLMGRGDALFKELMNSPNEPINVVVEISNLEKALLVNNPNLFRIYGQLHISYQLKCDVKSICRLMKKRYNKLDMETFMHNLIENLLPRHLDDDDDCDSEKVHDPVCVVETSVNTEIKKVEKSSSEKSSAERSKLVDTTNTIYTSSTETEEEPSHTKLRKRKKHTIFRTLKKYSSSDESLQAQAKIEEGRLKPKRKERSKSTKRTLSPTIAESLSDRLGIVKKKSFFTKSKPTDKLVDDIPDVKRILEEYAILCGDDPTVVNSPTWKETNLPKVYLRTFSAHPSYYYPEVVIYIHSLKLFENCGSIKDESINGFYLEYSFLSHEGIDMESTALPKLPNTNIFRFNFKKTFPIDLASNFADCKMLANMIKHQKTIVIEVISEPVEDMRKVQSCEIVGYCEIGLFDLIQLEDNVLKAKFEVKSFKNNSEAIGYLRITFSGIQAMRNVALQILAPASYKDQLRMKYGIKEVGGMRYP